MSEKEEEYLKTLYTMDSWQELTDMKKDFVRYYFANGCRNAADAARQAGSTSKAPEQIGSQWLKDPNVQEVLNFMRSQGLKDAAFTYRELIDKGRAVFDQAMADGDTREAGLMFERFSKYIMGLGSENAKGSTPKQITSQVMNESDYDKQKRLILDALTGEEIADDPEA